MHRRRWLGWITALLFIVAGANHFRRPGMYQRIIPPGFPYPGQLVWISGICEVAGGIGLLLPTLRRAAAWGLILLLIAVFPANCFMAMHPDRFADMHLRPWMLWARLPLQPLLMAWVWYVGARDD